MNRETHFSGMVRISAVRGGSYYSLVVLLGCIAARVSRRGKKAAKEKTVYLEERGQKKQRGDMFWYKKNKDTVEGKCARGVSNRGGGGGGCGWVVRCFALKETFASGGTSEDRFLCQPPGLMR